MKSLTLGDQSNNKKKSSKIDSQEDNG